MVAPIVTSTGLITSENIEDIRLLGRCFLEVFEELGAATVNFLGEERREYVDGEMTKIPENIRPMPIVRFPASAFFNAAYLVGRPVADGAEAVGTGAAMTYNAARNNDFGSEEFWMGVSASLAGLGAVVGTFAIVASPKLPITLRSLPVTTTDMVVTGTRGAPALAMSTATIIVPTISADGSAALAGVLTGPTIMYSRNSYNDNNTDNYYVDQTPEGIIDINARGLHDSYRANFRHMVRKPYNWQRVEAGDPAFENAPEMYRRIRKAADGGEIREVDIANLEYDQLPASVKNDYRIRAKFLIKKVSFFGRMWDVIKSKLS